MPNSTYTGYSLPNQGSGISISPYLNGNTGYNLFDITLGNDQLT